MSQAVSTFEGLDENTDLAISWPDTNRTERWVWRDGQMFKHGERRGVDPFFFTGLLAQNRIVPGDFAPPQVGEWFGYRNGRREHYRFYVARVEGQKIDLIYFTRGEYAGWTVSEMDRIFDEYERPEQPPTITPDMFRSVVSQSAEQKVSLEREQNRNRNMNDARQSMRYARDYINQAIEYAERRTT